MTSWAPSNCHVCWYNNHITAGFVFSIHNFSADIILTEPVETFFMDIDCTVMSGFIYFASRPYLLAVFFPELDLRRLVGYSAVKLALSSYNTEVITMINQRKFYKYQYRCIPDINNVFYFVMLYLMLLYGIFFSASCFCFYTGDLWRHPWSRDRGGHRNWWCHSGRGGVSWPSF